MPPQSSDTAAALRPPPTLVQVVLRCGQWLTARVGGGGEGDRNPGTTRGGDGDGVAGSGGDPVASVMDGHKDSAAAATSATVSVRVTRPGHTRCKRGGR